MDLSGNMTRQIEADMPVDGDSSHVANVGRLVEDMELKMRNLLRMFKPINLFIRLVGSCI
jgi:capping protein beta